MSQWPIAFCRFMERSVPIYLHIAAVKSDLSPFMCRGYSVRFDQVNGLLWITLLQSQWVRLQDGMRDPFWMSVLLTAGTDNESYQVKGMFTEYRAVTSEDRRLMEEQRKLTAEYFPHFLSFMEIASSSCLVLCVQVIEIYLQTPGPQAGSMLYRKESEEV